MADDEFRVRRIEWHRSDERLIYDFHKLILALGCLISVTLIAQDAKVTREAKVTQLLSKDLTNLPGKEGLMITVDYPPGSSDAIHRHYAHAFVHVLEGSVVMQVRGGSK